jgi:molecular chaperone DnaJ/curved DNA-binding protein
MQFKDYYKILGVPRDADEKAIKSAYRKKARQYHPDVNKTDASAEEKFKDLNEAYEVLKDSDKRSRYDRYGADWERYQQTAASGTTSSSGDFSDWFSGSTRAGRGTRTDQQTSDSSGFSDFFDTLFGDTFGRTSTRRRAKPQPQRGQDYEYALEIGLHEAYAGTTRRFDVQLQERCETCHGTGLNGTGVCPVCGGDGYLRRTKTLEVKVPAGVRSGSKVRVAGQGAPGISGGPNGDIYLNITIKPDPRFELDGNNLRTDVDVPLYTAILGGEIRVPTMDGTVELRIPKGTQNGQLFRLRGKGMPSLSSKERGDLLARLKVRLPTKLTDHELELFEQLRDSTVAKV